MKYSDQGLEISNEHLTIDLEVFNFGLMWDSFSEPNTFNIEVEVLNDLEEVVNFPLLRMISSSANHNEAPRKLPPVSPYLSSWEELF